MNECYTVDKLTTQSPILTNVKHCVILTMVESKRLTKKRITSLSSLCRTTYIFRNKGFKKCPKKNVTNSNTDLLYTYKYVFEYFQNVKSSILILEDDAVVVGNKFDFFSVDTFLATYKYDVYSFGSLGPHYLGRFGHDRQHRKYMSFVGYAQAIIYSFEARKKSIDIINYGNPVHMDGHVISKLEHKYTFHSPLIVQLFETTQNMSQWCYICNPKFLHVEKIFVKVFVFLLQNVLNLDKRVDNWKVLYFFNEYSVLMSIIVLLTFVIKKCK
jgi:hypothetical protein